MRCMHTSMQPAWRLLLRHVTGDLDLELVTKPIPRKLGFLSAIAPLSDSIGFISNIVVVKVHACLWFMLSTCQ